MSVPAARKLRERTISLFARKRFFARLEILANSGDVAGDFYGDDYTSPVRVAPARPTNPLINQMACYA